jgi:hypothetical protein
MGNSSRGMLISERREAYALEGPVPRDHPPRIRHPRYPGRGEYDGPVPPVRNQPENWLQMAGTGSGRRCRRSTPDPAPPAASVRPGGRSRRGRDAGTLSLVGWPQTRSQTPGERADRRARSQHDHRHSPAPRGPGAPAATTPTGDATVRTRHPPRSVANGLHGPSAPGRPGPGSSADDPR